MSTGRARQKDRSATGVHIRWMIRRDMPEVMRTERASFEYSWTEDDFLRCLRQRNCIGMVAETGDSIIGFMIYELHKTRLHVLNFAVHPAAPAHRDRRDDGRQAGLQADVAPPAEDHPGRAGAEPARPRCSSAATASRRPSCCATTTRTAARTPTRWNCAPRPTSRSTEFGDAPGEPDRAVRGELSAGAGGAIGDSGRRRLRSVTGSDSDPTRDRGDAR